ncbi:hypothetical protein RWE15_13315 [Virgibacillus halophilus]|uniref:DedA family protein n=1 Tax=Tigheibacillus halophilus TaxID=361280 RepID=A0ABU5C8T2_9BACI|nr:hypothetical protein [Virgibacillus halophilus]
MGMWYDLISQYGYVAIYLLLTLGIVGLPVPDEVLMAYLGYVTSIGKLSYTLTVLSGIAGSVTGITISYILGIKLGGALYQEVWSKAFYQRKSR